MTTDMSCSIADTAQQRVQLERFTRVEAGSRFVKAKQFRPGAHGAGNLETPLSSVWQIARRLVRTIGQADAIQPAPGNFHRFARSLFVGGHSEKTEHRVARGFHERVVLGDEQVFQKGQA